MDDNLVPKLDRLVIRGMHTECLKLMLDATKGRQLKMIGFGPIFWKNLGIVGEILAHQAKTLESFEITPVIDGKLIVIPFEISTLPEVKRMVKYSE
jgi:hypothetical protein